MAVVLRSGSATDRGKVRPTNQDCILEREGLYAVADGMGGHAGGEVAARTAVDTIVAEYERDDGRSASGFLARSIQRANRAIWSKAGAERSLRGMGTTLVGIALASEAESERLVIGNVGDSRAYLLAGGTLTQLTKDHTKVEEMLAANQITAEQAANHPHRHILTRALGTEPNVEIDAWQRVPATGDRYLLCSDGLFNDVSDAEIASVLVANPDPETAASKLVDLARAHGGSDNISVVVVDVVSAQGGSLGSDAPSTETGSTGPGGSAAGAFGGAATAESKSAGAAGTPSASLAGAAGTPSASLAGAAGTLTGALAGGAFGAAMMGIGATASTAVSAISSGSRSDPPEGDAKRTDAESSDRVDGNPRRATQAAGPSADRPAEAAPMTGGNNGDDEPPGGNGESRVGDEASPGPSPPDLGGVPSTARRRKPSASQASKRPGEEGPEVASHGPQSVEGPEEGARRSLEELFRTSDAMSGVMADVLRAADTPEWQLTRQARQVRKENAPLGAIALDHLFAASERASALRASESREALRDTIRHSEQYEKSHGLRSYFSRPGAFGITGEAHQGEPSDRAPLLNWRVATFLVVLALILLGGVGSIFWFQQNSYYVGLSGPNLAVYQGRPGGLAWFEPHLVQKTHVVTAQVLPSRVTELHNGVIESSVASADAYISNLVSEKNFASSGGATPATPSYDLTTTTIPPSTTPTSSTTSTSLPNTSSTSSIVTSTSTPASSTTGLLGQSAP